MAAPIGEADIVVGADARNFAKDVQSQAQSPLQKVGQTLSDAVGVVFKTGLTAAATLTGTAVGKALTTGFGRLEAIDSATGKMNGLNASFAAAGRATFDVSRAMDLARDAVLGTSFSLGDAATQMANFVTSTGDLDLSNRILKTMVGVAAGAGVSLQNLSDIFGDVAAAGRLTGAALTRLQTRGIPATRLLADSLGVTTDQIEGMVSAGQIGMDQFLLAMEQGFSGSAAVANSTFAGLQANTTAAMGRLGAAVQQPIFDGLKEVMKSLIPIIDGVTAAITPLVNQFAAKLGPAIQKVTDWLASIDFSGLSTGLGKAVSAIGPLLPLLGAMGGSLGPILSQVPLIGGVFSGLTGPVGLVIGLFTSLLALKPETLMNGFQNLAGMLAGAIPRILDVVTNLVPQMAQRLAENAGVFVDGLTNLVVIAANALAANADSIGSAAGQVVGTLAAAVVENAPVLAGALLKVFSAAISAIGPAVGGLLGGLFDTAPIVSSLGLLVGGFAGVSKAVSGVKSAISTAKTAITLFQSGLSAASIAATNLGTASKLAAVGVNIQVAASKVAAAATKLWTGIQIAFNAVMSLNPFVLILIGIAALVAAIVLIATKTTWFQDIWEAMGKALSAVVDWIVDAWSGFTSWVSGMVDAVVGFFKRWGTLILAVIAPFIGIPLLIIQNWDTIVAFFASLPEKIASFFAAAGQWLLDAGKAIIQGLLIGLGLAILGVQYLFTQFPSDLMGWLAAAGTWLIETGTAILTGLINGLVAGWVAVSSWFAALPGNIWNFVVAAATWIVSAGSALLDGFLSGITTGWTATVNWFTALPGVILGFFSNALNWIMTSGVDILTGLANGIAQGAVAVWNFYTSLPSRILGFLTGAASWLVSTGQSLLNGLLNGINAAWGGILSFFSSLPGRITGALSGIGSWLVSAGKDLIQGMINGVKNMAGAIANAAKDVVKNAVSAAKGFLGISSPSTVFASIGEDTMQGFVNGIAGMGREVDRAISTTLPSSLSVPLTGSAGLGASSSSAGAVAGNSRTVAIEQGAIQVNTLSDPLKVAVDVVDRIAERIA